VNRKELLTASNQIDNTFHPSENSSVELVMLMQRSGRPCCLSYVKAIGTTEWIEPGIARANGCGVSDVADSSRSGQADLF
jgi:hypothetical protein